MNIKLVTCIALLISSASTVYIQSNAKRCLAITEAEAAEYCKGLTGQALNKCLIECSENPYYTDLNAID